MSNYVYAVGFVQPDKSVLVYHKKNNLTMIHSVYVDHYAI